MELIILYGPPAVGKLTIAEMLATRTGYKIFQNNPTVLAVQPIFDFGTPEFIRTLDKIRLTLLEEAARSNIAGLIFTVCYDAKEDEATLSEMIDLVERAGGAVHLVQLTSPESVLFERIGNESRKAHGKLMNHERLRAMLDRYDLFTPYRLRDSLMIDTSECTALQSVSTILSSFGIAKDH
jgi:RNase adaptor protein for sRNA GlmZ degradation